MQNYSVPSEGERMFVHASLAWVGDLGLHRGLVVGELNASDVFFISKLPVIKFLCTQNKLLQSLKFQYVG